MTAATFEDVLRGSLAAAPPKCSIILDGRGCAALAEYLATSVCCGKHDPMCGRCMFLLMRWMIDLDCNICGAHFPTFFDAVIDQMQDSVLQSYLNEDVRLMMRAYTWLPGDFDPRTLHRRKGWRLRRYRGEHRPWTPRNRRRGLFTVDRLRAEVQATAAGRLEMHLRSLRRPVDPNPVYLGSCLTSVRFFDGPPDACAPLGQAYIEFIPDQGTATVPVFELAMPDFGFSTDDAPTGPIILDAGSLHRARLGRITSDYLIELHALEQRITHK